MALHSLYCADVPLRNCSPSPLSTLATTVAVFGDCRRIRRENSATVAEIGDYSRQC